MKRMIMFSLCATLILSLSVACQMKPNTESLPFADAHYDFSSWDFLSAKNEIFTYEQPDTDKIPLVIGLAGNTSAQPLIEAFAQQHPECQVLLMDITCGENNEALMDALDHGRIPDVLFTASSNFAGDNVAEHFTDVSDNPICQKYYTSALQQFDYDGKLYHFPGPSGSFGVIYNKTLFQNHGWEVPKTFDAFLALCRQIEADTNGTVDALNPNAKYAIWLTDLLLTPSYAQLLQKPQDYRWLQRFLAGNATFSGHMEPLFENAKALGEAGALTDEDWNQSATALRRNFLNGNIAMILDTWTTDFDHSTQYEYDMFPIPGKEESFVISIPAYAMSISKPTRPRSEKKQVLIDSLVTFASSGQGQSLLLDIDGLVPSVVDLPLDGINKAFPLLRDALEGGRVYQRESFSLGAYNINTLTLISSQARAIIRGEQTPAGACAAIDAFATAHFANKSKIPPLEIVGQVEKSFTILETTQLFCDIFREKAQADVAIVMQGATFRGNLMPLYAGDLDTLDITNLKPRSLTGGSTLVKLKMTGAALLDCLNHPYNAMNDTDYNVVYAFSGLKGTVRPMAPLGEKYVSVTLADGTPLIPDKVYTVATWSGMVWDRYAEEVLETYPETFEALFGQYLLANTPLSPANDGRMTLLWD